MTPMGARWRMMLPTILADINAIGSSLLLTLQTHTNNGIWQVCFYDGNVLMGTTSDRCHCLMIMDIATWSLIWLCQLSMDA